MLKKSLFHILPDVLSYLIFGARLDTVPGTEYKNPDYPASRKPVIPNLDSALYFFLLMTVLQKISR